MEFAIPRHHAAHLVVLLLVSLLLPPASFGQPAAPEREPCSCGDRPGALFLVDADGARRPANLTRAEAAWLGGGPDHELTPGLPVGEYVYQVTGPDGAPIAPAPVEARRVQVRLVRGKGRIATPVPLPPFAQAGLFRVWLTPRACHRPGEGVHGFLAAHSHVLDVLVREPLRAGEPVRVRAGDVPIVVYASDGRTPLAGWLVTLLDAGGAKVAELRTGDDGSALLPAVPAGRYELVAGEARISLVVTAGDPAALERLVVLGADSIRAADGPDASTVALVGGAIVLVGLAAGAVGAATFPHRGELRFRDVPAFTPPVSPHTP